VLRAELASLDRNVGPTVIPYVQESILLHHRDTRVAIPRAHLTDVFGLPGAERERWSGLLPISRRLLEPAAGSRRPRLIENDAELLVALFNRIGFAQRREREVGSWRVIGPAEAEGDGWQDWPAEHRVTREPVRIRFSIPAPGSPRDDAERLRRLAWREYQLTSRLSHDGLLRPRDLVEDELGTGLVYPRDDSYLRREGVLSEV
jgi:hypothetical protein